VDAEVAEVMPADKKEKIVHPSQNESVTD